MVNSEENYKFDLGVRGLRIFLPLSIINQKFAAHLNCLLDTVKIGRCILLLPEM